MYACFLETGRAFFAGVCGEGNQPLAFRDPPLPSRLLPMILC